MGRVREAVDPILIAPTDYRLIERVALPSKCDRNIRTRAIRVIECRREIECPNGRPAAPVGCGHASVVGFAKTDVAWLAGETGLWRGARAGWPKCEAGPVIRSAHDDVRVAVGRAG